MKIVDEGEVLARLPLDQVLPALEQALLGLADGSSVQPGQTLAVFPQDLGDTIYYPGALLGQGVIGVKISPYLTELARAGQPPVTAYTLLLSAQTGRPVLLADAKLLTTIRTAATTALAVRALMSASDRKVALVGAGPVAQWHARFVARLSTWDSLTFFAPSCADPARRAELTAALGDGIGFAEDLAGAVADADIVLLCTSSGTAVLDPESVKPGALITSISTNVPRAHEIPPESLSTLDVYCDYRPTCPVSAGEMVLAQERHGWDPALIIADLPELLSGKVPPRPRTGRPLFFRSIGLGIEDLAVATLLTELS